MGVKTSVYTPYCLVSYPMRIMPWVSLTLSKKCPALSEKAIQTRRKNWGLLCVRSHQFLQHAVESLPITIIRYCRNSRLHAHCFTCERSFFLWRPMFAEEPPLHVLPVLDIHDRLGRAIRIVDRVIAIFVTKPLSNPMRKRDARCSGVAPAPHGKSLQRAHKHHMNCENDIL